MPEPWTGDALSDPIVRRYRMLADLIAGLDLPPLLELWPDRSSNQ